MSVKLNFGVNNQSKFNSILFIIEEIFLIYRNKPKDFNIDHIIPLNGKIVSGLHVPWNLQALSERDNFLKKNQFDGTYENESWRKKK